MTTRLLLVLALAASAAACGRARPSVILLSIDSLRYDDVFGEDKGRRIAPHVSDLRSESVVFTNAYSAAPWTTPSMMAVMTGMIAPVHGVEEHDRGLASSVSTLAQRFHAAGYNTAAFVPEYTLRAPFGFGRGFDVYELESYGPMRPSSPSLLGKALHRLETWAGQNKPFFLWVHMWDPHFNYVPPPPYDDAFRAGRRPANEDMRCLRWGENSAAPDEVTYLRGQYRGEILFTDKYIGDLLDYLRRNGLYDKVILVVMADHGEAFEEHGWLTHTNRVDQEVVHVPLMIHWPKRLAPEVVSEVISTARVGRTLLRLAGLDDIGFGLEEPLPGLGIPGAPEHGEDAVSETLRQACYTSFTGARWKYVIEQRTCRESLFDLREDPGEKNDLARREIAVIAERRAALKARLERLRGAKIPHASLPPEVVKEAEEALRSLGYIAAAKAQGDTGPGCPFVSASAPLDTFGDAASAPCPEDGAWRCVKAH